MLTTPVGRIWYYICRNGHMTTVNDGTTQIALPGTAQWICPKCGGQYRESHVTDQAPADDGQQN